MKKSIALLLSFLMTGLYLAIIVGSFLEAASSNAEVAIFASVLAGMLLWPHLLLVFLGFVFNVIAFFNYNKGLALTSGILYAVAGFIFFPLIFFVIIQSILCFVGYAFMGRGQQRDLSVYQSNYYSRKR